MATKKDTALQVADGHDLIRVQGARVNNLKDIHVEIPVPMSGCTMLLGNFA